MSTGWDVLGIGTSAVDELVYVDRFPQPDTKRPVQDIRRQGGGLTATALVTAARQGARAAYCCLIGDDELSRYVLAELEEEGVDCSPCQRDPAGRPAHAIVIVARENGTRTILYKPGRIEPDPEHITPELVQKCRVLFIDYLAPQAGLRAAQIARQNGIPVVADVEAAQFPGREAFLEQIDHLIINIDLAAQLTGKSQAGEMAAALAGQGRACCVVTAGEQGCWYSQNGSPAIHSPAYAVPVVDTTGCGDVFHGSYAAALARGESIRRAVAVASASAGMKATQPGGRSGIPTLPAVEQFMNDAGRNLGTA